MPDKLAVLRVLRALNVPHLVQAFERATDPRAKAGHRDWVDEPEMRSIVAVASKLGPTGIGVNEWQAIKEIAKYDKVGPKAKTYLADLERRWNSAKRRPAATGTSVTLAHAEKYKGKVLGPAPYKGECAAGVQQVFSEAGKPLGLTATWKQGAQVKGNRVTAGTAIASFRNGRYWHHAAIFIRETTTGLEVWDQWAGRPWHKRTLYFKNNDTADGSNNGNLFFVIAK